MNDEYEKQVRKTLNSMMRLISIDEQIVQGKKKGYNEWGKYVDLKKERTKLKHRIYGYIHWLWYKWEYGLNDEM